MMTPQIQDELIRFALQSPAWGIIIIVLWFLYREAWPEIKRKWEDERSIRHMREEQYKSLQTIVITVTENYTTSNLTISGRMSHLEEKLTLEITGLANSLRERIATLDAINAERFGRLEHRLENQISIVDTLIDHFERAEKLGNAKPFND